MLAAFPDAIPRLLWMLEVKLVASSSSLGYRDDAPQRGVHLDLEGHEP
jgi:hypothetical protein